MEPSYIYAATVTRIVDGDTAIMAIDLGCHVSVTRRVRFASIDAASNKTDAGKAATSALKEMLPAGTKVVVKTMLDRNDKYGRLLGELFVNDTSVNETLLASAHAVRYVERGR